MYANICPNCGAYLDPGERCDCRDADLERERMLQKQREELQRFFVVERDGQMKIAV